MVDGKKSSKKDFQLILKNSMDPKRDVFQAIADPTRRQLLMLLVDKEKSIVTITKHFSLSRTAINKHLHILSEAGLVSSRRVGRETRYRFQPDPMKEINEWLAFFDQYWDEKLIALKECVENNED